MVKLLNLNSCAGLDELSLDLLSVFLGDAFLNVLGATLDQVLSLLQAQTGDLADDLDNAQLLVTETGQNDVELGLLLNNGSSGSSASAGTSNGSSGGNTELLLNSLNELVELQNGQRLDLLIFSLAISIYLLK